MVKIVVMLTVLLIFIVGCTANETKNSNVQSMEKRAVKERSIAYMTGYDYEDIDDTKVDRIKKWVEKSFTEEYAIISEGILKDKKKKMI